MSTEENYLDNLLRAVLEPKKTEPADTVESKPVAEEKAVIEEVLVNEPIQEEITEIASENNMQQIEVSDPLPEVRVQEEQEILEPMKEEPDLENVLDLAVMEPQENVVEEQSIETTLDLSNIEHSEQTIEDVGTEVGLDELDSMEVTEEAPNLDELELPETVEESLQIPEEPEAEGNLDEGKLLEITEELPETQEEEITATLSEEPIQEQVLEESESAGDVVEEFNLDEVELPEEITEAPVLEEVQLSEEPEGELNLEGIDLAEISEPEEELNLENTELPELSVEELGSEEDVEEPSLEGMDVPEISEPEELNLEGMDLPEISEPEGELNLENTELPELSVEESGFEEGMEEPSLEGIDLPEISEPEELNLEGMDLPEISEPEGELNLENTELPELPVEESSIEEIELPEISEPEEELNIEGVELSEISEPEEELNLEGIDLPEISEPEEEFNLENIEIPDVSIEESGFAELESPQIPEMMEEGAFNQDVLELTNTETGFGIGDVEMPEIPDEEPQLQNELSIDGLDEAIQSETELELAGELNIDELELDDGLPEIPDISDDLSFLVNGNDNGSMDTGDNLDDVLSMLDDDAELAEINDMLKKSDNNEPIQDDMMDLLNQMADDEAASVNAGIIHAGEDDGGIPLPEIPVSTIKADAHTEMADHKDSDAKEDKKSAKKKKKDDAGNETKGPGKLSKFFNFLTEELVPEPTEEELEAEKKAKEAKKQEDLTKKEQDKVAKDEEKKVKAEEKEAAKKAKAEIAAQKKKEKQAVKEAKIAKKKEKEAALPPRKRIPPKKIAAVSVFGVAVGSAVIVATNVLSTQGFLQSARKAYQDQDYKKVYQVTYDMNLDKAESDGIIQAKSEVILKLQIRYDSYQTNLKMGREIEALDALLQGIATYDTINEDAEKYDVLPEVDAIMSNIYGTLQDKYGLDETAARELMNTEDALTYTIALSDIVSGN